MLFWAVILILMAGILVPTHRPILNCVLVSSSLITFRGELKCAQAEASGLASPSDGKILISIHLSC